MSTHEEFPAELVEARANELRAAYFGASCGRVEDANPSAQADWRGLARLSLRREVEACEPLVKMLGECTDQMDGSMRLSFTRDRALSALAVHHARYVPAPERTVKEIAADVLLTRTTFRCSHSDGHATVSDALLDELAAAIKREREKGGAK